MPPQSTLLRTASRQMHICSRTPSKFVGSTCTGTATGANGAGTFGCMNVSMHMFRTGRPTSTCTLRTRQVRRAFSTASAHSQESFLNGTSSVYAEQMFELYQDDPSSVHASWKKYFENLEQGVAFQDSDYQNPTTAAAARKVAVSSCV